MSPSPLILKIPLLRFCKKEITLDMHSGRCTAYISTLQSLQLNALKLSSNSEICDVQHIKFISDIWNHDNWIGKKHPWKIVFEYHCVVQRGIVQWWEKGSRQIGPRTIGPRTVGPQTVGPRGPTVRGPICLEQPLHPPKMAFFDLIHIILFLKASEHSALYAKVRPEPPESLMQVTFTKNKLWRYIYR